MIVARQADRRTLPQHIERMDGTRRIFDRKTPAGKYPLVAQRVEVRKPFVKSNSSPFITRCLYGDMGLSFGAGRWAALTLRKYLTRALFNCKKPAEHSGDEWCSTTFSTGPNIQCSMSIKWMPILAATPPLLHGSPFHEAAYQLPLGVM